MPSVTAQLGAPCPSLGPHPGGFGWGTPWAGWVLGGRLSCILPPVLRFFLEYQWFVDFAVYSGGMYLFTEVYYYVVGPAKETNIAVFWCLLTVAFCMYPSSWIPARRRWEGGGTQTPASLTALNWCIGYQLLCYKPPQSSKLPLLFSWLGSAGPPHLQVALPSSRLGQASCNNPSSLLAPLL